MTKARTLADFNVSGVLTSASTLNPSKLDATGTIPSQLLADVGGGGKVLQVVSAETNSATSTTNSNLQDTALALNITPSSSDSKIFIQIMPQLLASSGGSNQAGLGFGISREIDEANNTTVFETAQSYDGLFMESGGTNSDEVRGYPNVFHLDSPNTTGVCRYKFRIKAHNGDNAIFNQAGGKSKMIAFEIAA